MLFRSARAREVEVVARLEAEVAWLADAAQLDRVLVGRAERDVGMRQVRDDEQRLLETLVAVRDAAPEILELKAVEPAKPADGGSSAEGVKPAGPPDAGGRTVQGPTAQASALGASAPPASIDPARGTPGTA